MREGEGERERERERERENVYWKQRENVFEVERLDTLGRIHSTLLISWLTHTLT